ncbi:MAG: hypothetical protein JST30_09060 [Armatimonadetes bacterium]|nr:hypothetical protein [Armatimonadota bacterium]
MKFWTVVGLGLVTVAAQAQPAPAQEHLPGAETDRPHRPATGASGDQTADILAAARDRMYAENDAVFPDGHFLINIMNLAVLAEIDPSDEETWSNLEWLYMSVQKYDLQWATDRRFAINNKAYADGPYYEAQMMFKFKAYAKVPALLEPVIAMTPPPDANAFRTLAHSYSRLGYFADCVRVWDVYIKIHPEDGQAKLNREKAAKNLKG